MNYTELFKLIEGKTGTIYVARKGTVTVFCMEDQTYLINNTTANGQVVVNPNPLYWSKSIDWAGGFTNYFTHGVYPAQDMPYKADPILPITPELLAKLAVRAGIKPIKYLVCWDSSRNFDGLEFAGEFNAVNSEYPEGILLFDSVGEAQAYIADKEPTLTDDNIKPALNFFDAETIEGLV